MLKLSPVQFSSFPFVFQGHRGFSFLLTQRVPVPPFTSALSCSFCWKRSTRQSIRSGVTGARCVRPWLTRVILSRLGRSGGDEPGFKAIGCCVHKRRALNTRLSSGTSAGTFAVSAGPYINYRVEAGMKNEPDPHVSNLRSRVCCFVLLRVDLNHGSKRPR